MKKPPTGAPGPPRPVESIAFEHDGTAMSAGPGQCLAAVLIQAGISGWGIGVDGRRKGVLCGMGVCFECLVTVNDARNVRACVTFPSPGDRVVTQVDAREELPEK